MRKLAVGRTDARTHYGTSLGLMHMRLISARALRTYVRRSPSKPVPRPRARSGVSGTRIRGGLRSVEVVRTRILVPQHSAMRSCVLPRGPLCSRSKLCAAA